MARPYSKRQVRWLPPAMCFRPVGIPVKDLTEVILTLDELEAIRLADCEGLYQEHAAMSMNVSRQTFGRIIHSARGKVGEILSMGKALRVEGGVVLINTEDGI